MLQNSPNDLQLLSDAPAHHLFCLLGPVNPQQRALPEVLVVLQVCLEGQVSKTSVTSGLQRGKRAAGDLIPWTVAQQFQDQDFPGLSGTKLQFIFVVCHVLRFQLLVFTLSSHCHVLLFVLLRVRKYRKKTFMSM